MSNCSDYVEAYLADSQEYDKARDELYGIHLPYDIEDHPVRARNMKELNEEILFYYDVIKEVPLTEEESNLIMDSNKLNENLQIVLNSVLFYHLQLFFYNFLFPYWSPFYYLLFYNYFTSFRNFCQFYSVVFSIFIPLFFR